MYCIKCGSQLNGNENHCPHCGNSIVNTSPTMPSNLEITYNNQQTQAVNKNDTQKKIIIILLLLLLLISLIGAAVIITNNNSKNRERVIVGDGSRTIMIYMVGSNLESDSKIATADLAAIDPDKIDLDKINILLYTGGTKKWHNFISNEENALYILKEDGFEKIETYKKENMGSPKTLVQLLDYGYKNYETDSYDLVLYNHGGAIDGAIYDDFTGDNLSLSDIRTALNNSAFNSENKLNTVTFRTCLNGTIEVANVLAPYANYLIASEEVTNGKSPSSVLKYLNDITTSDTEVDYGKKFIKAYEKVIDEIDPLGFATVPMYSIVDLSKVDKINTLLNEFIASVDLKNNYNDIVKIRNNLYQYGLNNGNDSRYDQVDLYNLVTKISKYANKDNDDLLSAISEAIVYNWSEKEKNSNGMSIYFPYNGPKAYQTKFLGVYNDLDINNQYYKFIKAFNSYKTSNNLSAFSASDIKLNQSNISSTKEFTLQLTEEQKNDYAQSIYIVFLSEDDGLYTPIYSSNNTELTDDGILKTNISNNLIKIYDKSENDEGGYFTLIERSSENDKKIMTNGILHNSGLVDDFRDYQNAKTMIYFNPNDNGIVDYTLISNDSESEGVSGSIIDTSKYSHLTVLGSKYKILDDNGNYTDNWDNNGKISGWEIEIPNVEFRSTGLEKDKKYYCVFKIGDIYGNEYYSKLQSLN